ncbi:MAG: DUF4230 domain-containing protein [Salinibacter sp.]|uniref:DUF4230 domain-containing protein n=1 Tax=Salinibacter sp. TaxID=2065818 RepID=UPI002FC36320
MRAAVGGGVIVGVLLSVGLLLWEQGPSDTRVQKTVLTTIQEEAPASFLVTGTLDVRVTVRIDSAQYLTPSWITYLLRQTQPSALPLLQGGSQTQVRVPGTVSYGFDVRALDPSMIAVEENGRVGVTLPSLSVHSVEPDLARLEVRSQASGWIRVLPSDMPEAVRTRALGAVKGAFREQVERRLDSATQPRVNTARALQAMLRPALEAAGMEAPQFRIRVGDELVLQPDG